MNYFRQTLLSMIQYIKIITQGKNGFHRAPN